MNTNAMLLRKRTEAIAEHCSNGGFFLALAALVVKIKNGPTNIKLYFRSSVN